MKELTAQEWQNVKATLHHFANVCCYTREDPMNDENRRWHLQVQGVLDSIIDEVLA